MRAYTIYVLDGGVTYECAYQVDPDGLTLESVSMDGHELVGDERDPDLFRRLYHECLDDAHWRLGRTPGYRWLHQAAEAALLRQ